MDINKKWFHNYWTMNQFNFTIEVTDSEGGKDALGYTLTIDAAPPTLRMLTSGLPDGEVSTPYSATLEATDGSGIAYTWTVTAGTLPPGLTLAPTGTPETTLSGTPTNEGVFTFTIQVEDSAKSGWSGASRAKGSPLLGSVSCRSASRSESGWAPMRG